jgi:signal transduction histidine kinase
MWRLALDEDRVLVEQLKLLLNNVGTSVLSTVFLSSLLVWTLSNPENLNGLLLWAAAVISSKLINYVHARRTLAAGVNAQNARKLVGTLMYLNAADGAAWGILPWVTLDSASLAGAVLVIAVMAGIKSYAMSVLSVVFPVYIAFCVFDATAIGLKLWQMEDPAYRVLAIVALLYVGTLIAQARINARVTRSVINLRFENTELIDRLRDETHRSQEARQDAMQANMAKSKFLAAASHDLRQPIHALGLFLEVISRGELSTIQRQMLENARGASRASSELLNALLDFSRIEAGVIKPQSQAVSMQAVLSKVEAEFGPQANEKGLFYRSRETYAHVETDPLLLELIVRNLVSNAIRYTKEGGVLVACRNRGQYLVLEVWDTGIGIEPSQHQEIFREFHQLGNPERDRNKGLGLGLAIVDRLVKELQLELTLQSKPGAGSVFRLRLPLIHVDVAPQREEFIQHMASPLKLQVLVVDDDRAILEGTVQLLESWGCVCDAVAGLDEALAAASRRRPDLVISDYRLRDQETGAQVIQSLRAHVGAELPALLVTGDTAPERLREAQSSGVPLLHKPVSPKLLYQVLYEIANKDAPIIQRHE